MCCGMSWCGVVLHIVRWCVVLWCIVCVFCCHDVVCYVVLSLMFFFVFVMSRCVMCYYVCIVIYP